LTKGPIAGADFSWRGKLPSRPQLWGGFFTKRKIQCDMANYEPTQCIE